MYNDVWANGITRKALLEAGHRLVDDGRLQDSEHFMEADWEEMQGIWDGSGSPSADVLAKRRETRMSLTFRDAPPFLGPPPSPPPAIEGLPPEVVRLNGDTGLVLRTMGFGASPTDVEDLTGTVASKGDYEGTARVVVGDYSFDRIQTGDVLVTSTHSEAFNAIVQKLGAIVADTGGPLSHLSIVSREIGIPCIVSCKNATVLMKDGDRVRLDGESGRVTILE
jgi:pyruvate,water dikinase